MQIEALDLPAVTGHSKEEIKEAYDQVLDYLTLPGKEFGTGVFAYSEEGESHFADCKGLFRFHATVLLLALTTVLVLWFLRKKGRFTPCRPLGKHYFFSCGLGTVLFMGLIGALAAMDFDKAFVIFHKIFFPGKENWLFHPREDQIILALPETFFLRCGVLILGSALLISLSLCIVGLCLGKNMKSKLTIK